MLEFLFSSKTSCANNRIIMDNTGQWIIRIHVAWTNLEPLIARFGKYPRGSRLNFFFCSQYRFFLSTSIFCSAFLCLYLRPFWTGLLKQFISYLSILFINECLGYRDFVMVLTVLMDSPFESYLQYAEHFRCIDRENTLLVISNRPRDKTTKQFQFHSQISGSSSKLTSPKIFLYFLYSLFNLS